jgi:hypothetical protein
MIKRRAIPLGVKVRACLLALGLDPDAVEFDHDPALGLRPIDPVTGDTIPPQNDPRYIVPRAKAAHDVKTNGAHVPLSGDKAKIAKLKRVEADEQAFRERVLAKTPQSLDGSARAAALSPEWRTEIAKFAVGKRWGKRKLQSGPFQKR